MQQQFGYLVSALTAIACTAAGCNESRYPPTFPTTGVVSIDGAPIERATVSFLPLDGQHPANGITDVEGRYLLSTFNKNDGARPGNFAVIIQKFPYVEIETTPEGTPYNPDDETDTVRTRAPKRSTYLLPKKYAFPEQSGFSATVSADRLNTFDFSLKTE